MFKLIHFFTVINIFHFMLYLYCLLRVNKTGKLKAYNFFPIIIFICLLCDSDYFCLLSHPLFLSLSHSLSVCHSLNLTFLYFSTVFTLILDVFVRTCIYSYVVCECMSVRKLIHFNLPYFPIFSLFPLESLLNLTHLN